MSESPEYAADVLRFNELSTRWGQEICRQEVAAGRSKDVFEAAGKIGAGLVLTGFQALTTGVMNVLITDDDKQRAAGYAKQALQKHLRDCLDEIVARTNQN